MGRIWSNLLDAIQGLGARSLVSRRRYGLQGNSRSESLTGPNEEEALEASIPSNNEIERAILSGGRLYSMGRGIPLARLLCS